MRPTTPTFVAKKILQLSTSMVLSGKKFDLVCTLAIQKYSQYFSLYFGKTY